MASEVTTNRMLVYSHKNAAQRPTMLYKSDRAMVRTGQHITSSYYAIKNTSFKAIALKFTYYCHYFPA
eukprot:scaffold333302_cov17-Prasinocladus_malaysianus.AAC.1